VTRSGERFNAVAVSNNDQPDPASFTLVQDDGPAVPADTLASLKNAAMATPESHLDEVNSDLIVLGEDTERFTSNASH